MEKMLTIRQVATIFGVSPSTVYGWLFKKVSPVPYYRINSRSIRFNADEVKGYINSIKIAKDI